MVFKNRFDAGEQLAEKLGQYRNSLMLAIPRGGVEVALPIAKKTVSKVDVLVVRKISTMQDPEVAIGAITTDGTSVYNEAYISYLGLKKEELKIIESEARNEALRREKAYATEKHPVTGKIVIVTDDGLATGYTMLAAIKSIKKQKPRQVIVAVPVAAANALELIRKECEVVCLHVSTSTAFSVASFYEEFEQLSDDRVIALLKRANEG